MEENLRNYKEELEEQLRELDELIKVNTKNLTKLKNLPDYGVKASTVRGCHQYYFVDKESGKRKYAGKEKYKLIKKLIQKEYAVSVDKKLFDLRNRLNKFILGYDINSIEALYDKLPDSRKNMLVPLVEPTSVFIQRWLEQHPGNQNTFPEKGLYQTNRGEMVRSKSDRRCIDQVQGPLPIRAYVGTWI